MVVFVVVVLWQKSQLKLLLSTCFIWLFAVFDPAAPLEYVGWALPAWSPWHPSQPSDAPHVGDRYVDGATVTPALFTLPVLWQYTVEQAP